MHFQRHKINKLLQIVFVSLVFLFVLVVPSLAQNLGTELIEETATTAGIGGADLPTILGRIFKIVLSVLGLIALIIVIIAGIKWMTSGGNPEKIKKAKAIMSAGLIGLLIIICAYAIVSFIISSLGGVTGPSTGCTSGLCCSDGWRCDSNSECTIPDATCSIILPQEDFHLARGEANFRSPSTGDYTIYKCSKIRAVFNHNINKDTFDVAVANSTLKVVDSDDIIVSGIWEAIGKTILFTPTTNFWAGESDYELIIPKTISDTNYKTLKKCASGFTPPYACTSNTTTVIWAFSTNDEEDITPPFVDSAYPIMDINNPLYPDRNVSRAPIIDVIFNENIDYTTIIDTSDPNAWHPKNNFQLCKIDGQGSLCTIGNEYDNNNLIITTISQGFRIFITNTQWLEPFTWYEIQVDGVDDMCNNTMAESQSWEFETNNNIPGVREWWPEGNNVCPDALIGIRFATSMYEYETTIKVFDYDDLNNPIIEGTINPEILSPGPYEQSLTIPYNGGIIRVVDDGDENTEFKIFELDLNNNLDSNTRYRVEVTTDLVIDIGGNTLGKDWDFDVTNMQICACIPIIYQILPYEGPRKSCVTITGHCFEGTTERHATIDPTEGLWFDDTQDPVIPEQDGLIYTTAQSSTANSIITIIPGDYGDPEICKGCLPGAHPNLNADIPDFLSVGVKIIYDDNNESVENFSTNQFTVIDYEEAQGPCIWRLLPENFGNVGYQFDIEGIKFGLTPGVINMESWIPELTYGGTWMPELIKQVIVPDFSTAGERKVTVTDSAGYISNPVPFDVIFDRPEVKEFGCNPPPAYSSPSPYKNTEDACIDIDLVVEFTKDMLGNSPLDSDSVLDTNNYTIESCGVGETFDSDDCPDNGIEISSIAFFTSDKIIKISLDTLPLNTNTWYQVSIAHNVESQEGVAMGNDYVWHFKTRDTDVCPVASIDLNPKNKTIMGCSGTELFTASPMASNCNALTPSSYTYAWSSTNVDVATVGLGNTYTNTVTGIDGGSTWIRVEEDESLKWTKELLNVNCCLSNGPCKDPDGDNIQECEESICDDTYGICTPVINSFNPASGSYNDWVTIQGCWFNNYDKDYSQVEFNGVSSIIPFDKCTSSAWQNEQIIAEVPETGTPFGAIQVTSAPYGSAFIVSSSSNFTSGDSHVGICNLIPSHGIPGSITQLTTNDNLLVQGANDDVYYGTKEAIGYPTPGWVPQTGIRSQSPLLLPLGAIDVEVFQNNYSNTLNFNVDPIGGGPEDECMLECPTGCNEGAFECSAPYDCLEKSTIDCRCCCDPDVTDACNNENLECLANQGNCTGTGRGLCCGCDDDDQCASAGCGFLDPNRCCHSRPTVGLGTCVASDYPTKTGLNTAFTLTFNQPMDISRLNNEYIRVSKEGVCYPDDGLYINDRCYLNGQIVSTNTTDKNITIFYPNNCKLKTSTNYKIEFIIGENGTGVRSSQGVAYGLVGNNCTWNNDLECEAFDEITAPLPESSAFCVPEKISVEPRNFIIRGIDETKDFIALALDKNDKAICVTEFAWESSNTAVATVDPASALSTIATSEGYGDTLVIAKYGGKSCENTIPTQTCGNLKVTPTNLPRVIEQQGCEICANGGQSPSPYKDSEENCPNAQIVVRFNREMDISTLIPANIVLEKLVEPNWNVVNIVAGDMVISPDATTLYIDTTLIASTSYRVRLISGLESGTTGIKDTNGLPLDGNRNDIQDGSPVDDYVWSFETGATNCDLNKICINPQGEVQLIAPSSQQNYYTDVYASNCNYLEASDFNGDYSWQFIHQNPADPTTSVAGFFGLTNNYNSTVQAKNLGETDIEAIIAGSPQINDFVHLVVVTYPLVESSQPSGVDVCRNTLISVTFNQIMDESTISSDTVQIFGKYDNAQPGLNCTGCGGTTSFENLYNKNIFANLYYQLKNFLTKKVKAQATNCWCELSANISTDEEDNKTILNINAGLLEDYKEHKIIIKSGIDGVKTKYGLELSSDYVNTFTTSVLCNLDSVTVEPGMIYFTTAGQIKNIEAHAFDNRGDEIESISGVYEWDWEWTSTMPDIVDISGDPETQLSAVTSKAQDGFSQITATATLTTNIGGNPVSPVEGSASAQVFICEHPWIYVDLDPDTNFKLPYCRDNQPLLLPRLLLGGETIPSNCGNGVYEPDQGEDGCDGFDNTPVHATCLFDCSAWVCDDYYHESGGVCTPNVPFAPSGLSAQVDENNPESQINLNWIDNSTNEDGFKIERKVPSLSIDWIQINTVNSDITFYSDEVLNSGTTYYYKVRAYNTYGNAPYSNEASASTGCAIDQCFADDYCYDNGVCLPNSIQICSEGEWINSCGDGEVNCSEACDGLLPDPPVDNAHCMSNYCHWECDTNYGNCDANWANGCEEDLRDSESHCGACNTPCATTCTNGICEGLPATPNNFQANLNPMAPSTKIDLGWDNAGDADNFEIQYKTAPMTNFELLITLSSDAIFYSHFGLEPDTTYNYKIQAQNIYGDSGWNFANATTASVPIDPPNAPTALTGIATNTTVIDLTWIDNSDVANNNQEAESKIYRKSSLANWWAQIGIVNTDIIVYEDNGLTPDTTYLYKVIAYNSAGSAESNIETVSTPPTTPSDPIAPSNFLATLAPTNPSGQINLSWNDNSTDEDGFEMKYSIDGGAYNPLVNLSENYTAWSHYGLTEATNYGYKIRSYKLTGQFSIWAEKSKRTSCPMGECEHNDTCYEIGECKPGEMEICDNAIWENSCGDGDPNCGEMCDFNETPPISWDPSADEVCYNNAFADNMCLIGNCGDGIVVDPPEECEVNEQLGAWIQRNCPVQVVTCDQALINACLDQDNCGLIIHACFDNGNCFGGGAIGEWSECIDRCNGCEISCSGAVNEDLLGEGCFLDAPYNCQRGKWMCLTDDTVGCVDVFMGKDAGGNPLYPDYYDPAGVFDYCCVYNEMTKPPPRNDKYDKYFPAVAATDETTTPSTSVNLTKEEVVMNCVTGAYTVKQCDGNGLYCDAGSPCPTGISCLDPVSPLDYEIITAVGIDMINRGTNYCFTTSYGSTFCSPNTFKCDEVCKKQGKVCSGVGLINNAINACIYVVHDEQGNCGLGINQAGNDCRSHYFPRNSGTPGIGNTECTEASLPASQQYYFKVGEVACYCY